MYGAGPKVHKLFWFTMETFDGLVDGVDKEQNNTGELPWFTYIEVPTPVQDV